MHERRDRITIIADILSLARKPISKTRMMYGANLSFTMSRKYIDELLSLDFLEQGTHMQITEKGADFLEKYDELMKLGGLEDLCRGLREQAIEIAVHLKERKTGNTPQLAMAAEGIAQQCERE